MSVSDSNRAAHLMAARLVVEQVARQRFDTADARVGELATNYFSFVFPIELPNSRPPQKLFVKMPKADLRRRDKTILPVSPAEQRMAADEAESLRTLGEQWRSEDLRVGWVRLRGEIPEYNAIVTDAVEGEPAETVLRQLDLRRRVGSIESGDRLRNIMTRLGVALGRFHNANSTPSTFRFDADVAKVERYCNEIESSERSPVLSDVRRVLGSMRGCDMSAAEVLTLKGIDIRNVLIDDTDRIFLLDPGRLKRSRREADLARFILTYRILYWGSGLFLLGLRPDKRAEQAFLDGYNSTGGLASPKMLAFFLLKEGFKHWHTALDSLRLREWPSPVKRFFAATVVNPYYSRHLSRELRQIT